MGKIVDKNATICGTCEYFRAKSQQKVTSRGVEIWPMPSSCTNRAVSMNAQFKADRPACKKWVKWSKLK